MYEVEGHEGNDVYTSSNVKESYEIDTLFIGKLGVKSVAASQALVKLEVYYFNLRCKWIYGHRLM